MSRPPSGRAPARPASPGPPPADQQPRARPPAREPDDVLTGRPSGPSGHDAWGAGPTPPGAGGPTLRTWSWTSSGRSSFPWFPVLLVLLGVGLLIEQLVPELSIASLIILAVGIAFLLAWLLRRIIGATVPALVLLAWGGSRIATELDVVGGEGWSTFAIGIALLIGWGLGRFQRTRRQWALWLGLILTIIGLADISDRLPFAIDAAIVVPLAIIAVGVYLVWRNRDSLGSPGLPWR